MQRVELDAPEILQKALSRKGDITRLLTFESPAEFADHCGTTLPTNESFGTATPANDWNGGMSLADAVHAARHGDLSAVKASDALLAQFETYAPETSRRGWRDDVTGALPNVPAFIAGHPLNMRRRIKTENEFSPIAIICDTTSSAVIEARDIRKHGIAVLALVRAMSATRPVELWVGGGLGLRDRIGGAWCFTRIETAPLDLSSAAHMLTHPSVSRRLIYGTLTCSASASGAWPNGSEAHSRRHMESIIAPAFSHVTETLCVPAIHCNDASVDNPVAWIREQLAKHSPTSLPDAT